MAYEGRSLWDFGIDRSWLERYVLDYACEDVLAYHIAVSPIAMFYASNLDVPNPERFPETRFYREWVVAQGLAYAAGGIVMREGEWMTEIYLQRSPLQPPFSRAELAQLDPLIPHLQRALQMRQRFIDLQLGEHLFASMLDVLVIPAMLFDENGCLVRANARASEE